MHGFPKYGADFRYFDYVNPEAPKRGVLRQGVAGSFDSLNPFIVKGTPALGSGLVTLSLMARSWDEPFSLYGQIAETVTTPPDRAWVEFALRPEARWGDGQRITAEDVLFSFETLKAKGRPNHRSYYARVAKAEAKDGRTVRFTFAQPDREMPLIMGLMPVLAKHVWEGRTFDATTVQPFVGSGPYRVARVEPGHSVTYERVKDWWGENLAFARGAYNFDAIRFDYYRDDGIALEAFKAHAFDVRREGDVTKWATGYDVPAARDGRMALEVLPHGRPEWARGLIFNTRRPLFADRRVRAALGYAFDFAWMNKTLFHSALTRTASYFPNSELAATGLPSPDEMKVLEPLRDELPAEVFTSAFAPPSTDGPDSLRANLRHAAAMLKEAGWTVKDGVLVDAKGEPFTFEILLGDPADERGALEFSRALEKLGIKASVRTADSAQYQGRLETFDFDMTVNRWISTLSPGNEQITMWGSAFADREGSRNYAGIKSPAVDALCRAIAQADTRETLVADVRALDRALSWGHYMVPLYYAPGDRFAYWKPVKHPDQIPLYGSVIETWWMGD